MNQYKCIETNRLILTIMQKNDFERIFTLMNTKEVLDMMVLNYPLNREDVYKMCHQSPSLAEEGKDYNYIISLKNGSNIIAGMCVLLDVNTERKKAELGYWIIPSQRRRGIAFEACSHLLSYTFSHLDFHKIWAETFYFNIPSQRFLEKLGFTRIGILKQEVKKHGAWQDRVLYELVKKDCSF
jgi:ribosomal-protein-alanine N-acetyltransferase